MEPVNDNMQKYYNYREQMGRLKKALNQKFYLEAIFIEYAIMEDRLESILRHAGKWDSKTDDRISISKKITKVNNLIKSKNSIAKKYLNTELTDGIRSWKNNRNVLIHALLKQQLHTEDLQAFAEEGQVLVKALCSKATSFRRAIEKKQQVEENKNG